MAKEKWCGDIAFHVGHHWYWILKRYWCKGQDH